MTIKTLCFTFFLFLSFHHLIAQNPCRKTSVYFDLNKSELTHSAIAKLDSLCRSLTGTGYVIELYGYSDSTATYDYNMKLSQQRISAVQDNIDSKVAAEKKFLGRNMGESEDATTSQDLALNRRVDIYVLKLKDNQIVIDNAKESVELPIDYFEPCGICASKPQLKSYFTQAEADPDRIRFETVDGGKLTTAGTVKLDYNPCDQNEKWKNSPVTFRIPAASYDPEMTIWEADTANGFIVWKKSEIKPLFDPNSNEYVITGTDRIYNVDKPCWTLCFDKKDGSLIIYPEVFRQMNSKLITEKTVQQITENDTMLLHTEVAQLSRTGSWGVTDNTFYYLNKELNQFLVDVDSNRVKFTISKKYVVPLSAYTEFGYSNVETRIKLRKHTKIENVGYFIEEVNVFIPISESLAAGYVLGKKPLEDLPLSIIKKGKLYSANYRKLKIQKSSTDQLLRIKLTNRNLNHFQLNKNYVQEQTTTVKIN